jgi:hypothetical protein
LLNLHLQVVEFFSGDGEPRIHAQHLVGFEDDEADIGQVRARKVDGLLISVRRKGSPGGGRAVLKREEEADRRSEPLGDQGDLFIDTWLRSARIDSTHRLRRRCEPFRPRSLGLEFTRSTSPATSHGKDQLVFRRAEFSASNMRVQEIRIFKKYGKCYWQRRPVVGGRGERVLLGVDGRNAVCGRRC